MFTFLTFRTPACNGASDKNSPQLFDLLQMSRLEKEYALIFRRKMRGLASCKKTARPEGRPTACLITSLEKIYQRRQAQDAALFYLLMRRKRMKSFAAYMRDIPRHANDAGLSFAKVS